MRRVFQHSVTQRNAAAVTQLYGNVARRSHWLNVIAALIGRVRLWRCGKNRSRFCLLAECRRKQQALLRRLRLRKK